MKTTQETFGTPGKLHDYIIYQAPGKSHEKKLLKSHHLHFLSQAFQMLQERTIYSHFS